MNDVALELKQQELRKLEYAAGLEQRLRVKVGELRQAQFRKARLEQVIEDLEAQLGQDKRGVQETLRERAVGSDEVDRAMDRIVVQGCRVPIYKISSNYYQFGTRKIHVKEDPRSGELMARDRSGRYVEVNQYVAEYEDIEAKKAAI